MKKLWLLLACALLLSTTSLASAACSPEEAQKKANEFAAAVQKKSQADPQGYAKIMQELQPQLLKLQQVRIWKICASSMMMRWKS